MKFLFCIVIIAILAAFANAERCLVPCTREYRPVCGSDGQQYKMFPNMCTLKNEHCKDGNNWLETRTDECQKKVQFEENQECAFHCSDEFRPVCGTDGKDFKIFTNVCHLVKKNCIDGTYWFQALDEECQKKVQFEENQECAFHCSDEFRPVCGTDGKDFKIFTNLCHLVKKNCIDGTYWFQALDEECQKKVQFEENQECAFHCSDEFRPVCGTDGKDFKIFTNLCHLVKKNCIDGTYWFQALDEECQKKVQFEENQECAFHCSNEFRPVCGTDGKDFKIFTNLCHLVKKNCIDGTYWYQAQIEECQEKVEVDEK